MRSSLEPWGGDFVDSQGAAKLIETHQAAETNGVTLRLARLKPNVLKVLRGTESAVQRPEDNPSH